MFFHMTSFRDDIDSHGLSEQDFSIASSIESFLWCTLSLLHAVKCYRSYSSQICNSHSSSVGGRNMNIFYLILKKEKGNSCLKWKIIYMIYKHMRRIQFYAHGGLIRWHSGFVSFQQPWTITTKNITHLYRVADSVSVTTQTTPESNL